MQQSERKYTPDQQKVIDLRGCDMLVSAAAGSGKTAVLVERIIRKICDEENRTDIDRLLIVTFTNAAAAEMRERIRLGITARLNKHPDSSHIQRQATLLHNAQITTIDSFCLFLIRNHFQEIGLDPAFRVADQGEIKLLRQDVMAEMLERFYEDKNPAFFQCVEYFCPGGKEKVLEQYIFNLYDYAESYPAPNEWLLARKRDYATESLHNMSPCGTYFYRYLRLMIKGCLNQMEQVRCLCQEPDGPYMYGALIDDEVTQLEAMESFSTPEEYGTYLSTLSFARLPSKKDDSVSSEKRELAKKLRSEVKDALQEMREYFFATPENLAKEQAEACAQPVSILIDLVLEFGRILHEKKQEKHIIDFSDMEHFALQILYDQNEPGKTSSVAKEYRKYFQEILIDEYQDSNLVQEYILKAISGEEDNIYNLFMVGDVKQSIYKFRLARPELFLEKQQTYQEEGNHCRIDLSMNFRSRPQVLHTVNDVFEKLMNEDTGGILYDDKAALYPGAVYPDTSGWESELLLVQKPEGADSRKAKQAECLSIAAKIKDMYRTLQVTDKETGELRPVSYRDIVILLRTTSGWDEEFRKVLEEEGIPAYITSKTGYFSATEVQGLLQFLRVLDNPGQDIPLFGVMKSIFGGFSDEEIARIRIGRKDRSLYEAVEAVAYTASVPYVDHEANKTSNTETGNEANLTFDVKEYAEIKAASVASTTDEAKNSDQIDEWHSETEKLPIKCRNFINKVTEYRLRTAYTPISELLQQIATDHDYLPYVSALPSGSKRKANVEMLFTKAADFEKTSYVGLFHFVRYMEQLEKYDVDYGEAETLDENADVVRIMSIHKSKGLEFPIVFVAGLAKRFNRQDVNQALLMDIDLGLGVDYVNVEKRYRNRTLRRGILSKKLREDNLAEELRVLYVAMTRPKEKLILTACIDKAEEIWEAQKTWKHWHMSYFSFMNMSCMLDFIFQALPLPSMQVSIQTPGTLAAEQLEEQVHFHGRLNQLSQADQLANPATLAQISQNLSFRYPYKPLEHLYAKMTVSELKKASRPKPEEDALTLYQEKEVIPYIPAFCREKTSEIPIAAAVLKGNAYHKIMEWIDFDALYRTVFDDIPNTFRAFHEEMDRKLLMESLEHCIQQEQRLTEEYRSAIDLPELTAFFLTATAYRMWKAQISGKLFREQPFVYGIPANRLPEQIHKQNTTDQGTSIYATSRQSEHIQQQNITGKDADSSNTIRIPEQEQHLSKVHMTDTLDNTAIESSFLSQETVLIQGIIDAFLIEDNQIILIDYKTDQVRTPSQLRNRYALQMQYYEKALTKLMNLPVTHKVIYSFYLTQEIVLPDAT